MFQISRIYPATSGVGCRVGLCRIKQSTGEISGRIHLARDGTSKPRLEKYPGDSGNTCVLKRQGGSKPKQDLEPIHQFGTRPETLWRFHELRRVDTFPAGSYSPRRVESPKGVPRAWPSRYRCEPGWNYPGIVVLRA